MLLILLFSVITVYAGGIGNAKEFVAFAKAVNEGAELTAWQNDKGAVCLLSDINMKSVKEWTPIKEFKGTFDGKGFALTNWRSSNALFDVVAEGAVVENLRIDKSCSLRVVAEGEVVAGFIANTNYGTIKNCVNEAPITFKGEGLVSRIYIGGLVGRNGYVVCDSQNKGDIVVEAHTTSADAKLSAFVGGVAAAMVKKSRGYYTIFRCENSGTITYNGNIPRSCVAGIIGRADRIGVRLCVNRGSVSALFEECPNGVKGYSYAGGIVGNTATHVQSSDNFGTVTVEGRHIIYAGGVCGGVLASRNVVGCMNYGRVVSKCSVTSVVAGVLGVSKRGAHLCNSNNYGEVSFEGAEPEKSNYLAGVAGSLSGKNGEDFGPSMRCCNNFGKVTSRLSSSKMSVAGVVCSIRGTDKLHAHIVDCANKGVVSADGCKVDDMVLRNTLTEIEGDYFHNDYAQAVEEKSGEANLYGRVTSTTGEPIVGVVVSDGLECVQTDANGYYAIKSDLSKARFVHISTPSEYKFSFRKNMANGYFQRIPRHAKAVVANFVLEKREKEVRKYTVVMMGDPQIRGVGVDSAVYRIKNFVYPDISKLREEKRGEDEFFAINLGDLLFNDMTKYDDYLDCAAESPTPMFHAIGNHDHDQATILETPLGTIHYEEYVSPVNYSFNIGKTHYVVMDNISWQRKTSKIPYESGLEDWICDWLERDLQFVPKDYTIIACTHSQLFRRPTPVHLNLPDLPDEWGRTRINYDRYSKLLSQYARVYAWSGHYHYNYGYDYKASEMFPHLKNVVSICVARCCGGLHVSRELYNDGTPQGYMVLEVDGEKMEWYYKTVGYDRSHQMNVYSPTRNGTEFVKVNIWNWAADYWSTPEWWENGKKVADMINEPEKDIAYLENYAKYGPFLGRKGDDKAIPHNAHGTFHIKPSEGVRSGEVRVTDNFGKTYIEKIEW